MCHYLRSFSRCPLPSIGDTNGFFTFTFFMIPKKDPFIFYYLNVILLFFLDFHVASKWTFCFKNREEIFDNLMYVLHLNKMKRTKSFSSMFSSCDKLEGLSLAAAQSELLLNCWTGTQ